MVASHFFRILAIGVLISAVTGVLAPRNAGADVLTAVAGGIAANEIVEKMDESLSARIAQAASSGEYLSEKLYSQLRMLLASADQILGNNINATFENLTDQQQQFFRTIERIAQEIEQTRSDVLDLEQFIAMDLATIAGLFPFVDDDTFLLRRIDGYSQVYRDGGSYKVVLTGRAFAVGNEIKLTIDGQSIAPEPFTQDFRVSFAIPSHLLNAKFSDEEVSYVPMNILVESVDRPGFIGRIFGEADEREAVLNFSSQLLLLPKFPVTYELVEVHSGQGWSEGTHSASGSALAARTGISGKWNSYRVCVSIPADALMIVDTAHAWVSAGVGPGSWGDWEGGYQYLDVRANGPTQVCRGFAHQIHDQDRTLAIQVSYRTPVTTHGRVPVTFHDPITSEEYSVRLKFGELYEASLNPSFITYYLRLRYFNGESFTLQRNFVHQNAKVSEVNKDGYAALTLSLKNPYE